MKSQPLEHINQPKICIIVEKEFLLLFRASELRAFPLHLRTLLRWQRQQEEVEFKEFLACSSFDDDILPRSCCCSVEIHCKRSFLFYKQFIILITSSTFISHRFERSEILNHLIGDRLRWCGRASMTCFNLDMRFIANKRQQTWRSRAEINWVMKTLSSEKSLGLWIILLLSCRRGKSWDKIAYWFFP